MILEYGLIYATTRAGKDNMAITSLVGMYTCLVSAALYMMLDGYPCNISSDSLHYLCVILLVVCIESSFANIKLTKYYTCSDWKRVSLGL